MLSDALLATAIEVATSDPYFDEWCDQLGASYQVWLSRHVLAIFRELQAARGVILRAAVVSAQLDAGELVRAVDARALRAALAAHEDARG